MSNASKTSPFKLALALATPLLLGGCLAQEVTHGYVVSPEAIDQVPVGSSQEQVALALGSPSTVESFGQEGWYYISQKVRKRAAFANGRVVGRRVLAVYFDDEGTVSNIANYGLEDGKVFDYNRNITATGGKDLSFIAQILTNATQTDKQIFGR